MTAPNQPRGRRWATLVRAVAAGAATALIVTAATTPAGAASNAGAAGTDTRLPPTASQVTVSGRGPFADLRVTLNQTQDLVNQAVSVSWTGGVPTATGNSLYDAHYLQIMQCWGDDDGTNPANPGPPPEQCVQGAADSSWGGRHNGVFPAGGMALERVVSRDGWDTMADNDGVFDPATGYLWKPFRSVDGTEVGIHYDSDFSPSVEGGSYWLNPFFNSITTNEIVGGRTQPDGTGAELFEVTTGLENPGLGCGQRVQRTDTGLKETQCWLVIVPRGDAEVENAGTPYGGAQGLFTSPLSTAAWANRIAVPLSFIPVESPCNMADQERRLVGSEVALAAIGSWQPALCATGELPPYAYASVGESSARQQIASAAPGSVGMAVVARPLAEGLGTPQDPFVYAPLTASGLTVGFHLERRPKYDAGPEAAALRGTRVANINLTPRLVAKLLTQSYRGQIPVSIPSDYDWVKANPAHMAADPDFVQFNPEFADLLIAGGKNFGGMLVTSAVGDVPHQVWSWILADPEAAAWLAGAADEWGMVVNPVYATTAEANRYGVPFAATVPESFPKSEPHCHQAPSQGPGGSVVPPPLCGTDWFPYSQTLQDAARQTRTPDDRSRTVLNPFAITSSRVYGVDGPQPVGQRNMLAIATSSDAHRYGLQMARLSAAGDNGPGRRFVAPDSAGLQAGLAAMTPSPIEGVRTPDPTAVGAYPLTMVTYAVTAPLRLDAAARSDYAALLAYAAEAGQAQGYERGQLPYGYLPLPEELRAQTARAAGLVRNLEAPTETPPAPTPQPDGTGSGGSGSIGGSGAAPGGGGQRGGSASGGAAPSVSVPTPSDPSMVEPAVRAAGPQVLTPIMALARNRYVLPVLAGLAVAAAVGIVEISRRPRRALAPAVGAPS